jgi:hypothetical protein
MPASLDAHGTGCVWATVSTGRTEGTGPGGLLPDDFADVPVQPVDRFVPPSVEREEKTVHTTPGRSTSARWAYLLYCQPTAILAWTR